MQKNNFFNYPWEKIFVLALIFNYSLPFLLPFSIYPVGKFPEEITTVFFVLVLFWATQNIVEFITIPPVAIASFLFAIYILVQSLILHTALLGINYAVAIEFLFLALTTISISSMISKYNKQFVLLMICYTLFITGIIQTFLGYCQVLDYSQYLQPYVINYGVNHAGAFIVGNIGQRNMFALYIAMGTFSGVYLRVRDKINSIIFVVFTSLNLIIIVLTASRSSIIYFLGVFVLCLYKNKTIVKDFKKSFTVLCLVIFGFGALQIFLPKVLYYWSNTFTTHSSAFYRFNLNFSDPATFRRVIEWQKALYIFGQHYILGVGWFNFSHFSTTLMLNNNFASALPTKLLYTNCHNLIFNILAETGLIGFGILLVYGIGFSVVALLRNTQDLEDIYVLILIIPLVIDSMFEYPLWNVSFLFCFAILLAFAKPVFKIKNILKLRTISQLIFMLLVLFLIKNCVIADKIVELTEVPVNTLDYKKNIVALEELFIQEPLWDMPILMAIDCYTNPNSEIANQNIPLNKQLYYSTLLTNLIPTPNSLYKQILLNKALGNNLLVLYYTNLLIKAYPSYMDKVIRGAYKLL